MFKLSNWIWLIWKTFENFATEIQDKFSKTSFCFFIIFDEVFGTEIIDRRLF